MLRETIKTATITAMKAGDKPRTHAHRLISAKIKDRDIELRGKEAPANDDAMVMEVLQKMAKQRRESITMFDDGGRTELADQERAELAVIEEYLPTQMSEADSLAAIAAIKAEIGAESIKDMGKIMGALKGKYGAEMDMSKAGAWVKGSFG